VLLGQHPQVLAQGVQRRHLVMELEPDTAAMLGGGLRDFRDAGTVVVRECVGRIDPWPCSRPAGRRRWR
jgi:hypothetical protein